MYDELRKQFPETLEIADFMYLLKKEEKEDSWKDSNLAWLYKKMKRHNIELGSLISNADGTLTDIVKKANNVLLYAFMISERARMLTANEYKQRVFEEEVRES